MSILSQVHLTEIIYRIVFNILTRVLDTQGHLYTEIKRAAMTSPFQRINSLNNCGRINNGIRLAIIQDTPISSVYLARGTVHGGIGEPDQHMFVVVPQENQDDIVVDGAISQFNSENFKNGDVKTSFGSKSAFGPSGEYNELVISKIGESPFNYYITARVD